MVPRMKTSLVTFLLGLAWIASPLPAHGAVGWDSLLDQSNGSQVRFGVLLGGKEPFSRNADEAFAPASTSKLFTAGAALARLGADFRFATTLRWTQKGTRASGLQLIGSGDPTWGMPQFGENSRTRLDHIAKTLKAAGVTEVEEPEVSANDPRWNEVTIPAGWKAHDILSCGGSLGQAFNLSLNCATYKVTSASEGAWLSAGLRFPVEHRVKEGERTALAFTLVRSPKMKFVLNGTFKTGDAARNFVLPVFETLSWAKALFRQALVDQGIKIVPAGAFGGDDPRGEPKSLSFVSPPLAEILKPFLKNSVNFLGDAILRALAVSHQSPPAAGPGLLEPSLDLLRDYLLALGLPRDFLIHDGSGLSRTSRCSPRLMLEFLERVQREPYFPVLRDALAVAGVDGTLRNRMKGTAAQGKLRAKTGTLEGVYNLAGYVPAGREHVPFVILTRTTSALQGAARNAEDRVGAALTALHQSAFVSDELPATVPYPYVPEQAGMDDQ
jgi:D-alanyl-D-alanine carboxypeptidase/D-alanyl-D-alanine-endopeptidase (penicillin-binding protein 4)